MSINTHSRVTFIEEISISLFNRIVTSHNCTNEAYWRKMMTIILNRIKCSFYVKYFELLYEINEKTVLKAFYERKKSKTQHEQLKLIYNWLYVSRPNYFLIDVNGIMGRNMKEKQSLIDTIEQERNIIMQYTAVDGDNDYKSILPELIGQEIESIQPQKEISIKTKADPQISLQLNNQMKKTNQKDDDSMSSLKYFISSLSNIESKASEKPKGNNANEAGDNNNDSHHIINNTSGTREVKLSLSSIRNSLASLDFVRENKRKKLKTTKQSKIFLSLNQNKPFCNPMFPSTRSFFFLMNKKENKMNEMRACLNEAIIESSNNRKKCELFKPKRKMNLPQVVNSVNKSKVGNDLGGYNGEYFKGNFLNLHTYTQMALSKKGNAAKMKSYNKKSFLLSQYYNNNTNNYSNASDYSNNCCTMTNINNNKSQTLSNFKQKKPSLNLSKNMKMLKISIVTIN